RLVCNKSGNRRSVGLTYLALRFHLGDRLMKSILTTLFCTSAAFLAIMSANSMAATIDDFSDLNDTVNPTWTHLFNEIGSSGQSWDASTGEYRLKAPTNGANVPPAGQLGFVASYTGPVSTDVLVSADIVEPTGSPLA